MRAIVILLTMAAVAIAPSLSTFTRPAAARAFAAQDKSLCQDGAPLPAIATDLGDGLPPGLQLTLLAEQTTDQMPPYTDGLVLTLRQITLAPDAATKVRLTNGPLLFYVASGEIVLSIGGQLQTQAPGSAEFVDTGQRYALQNDRDTPAILWRVALVPSGLETTVGWGDIAQVIDGGEEIAASAETITSRLLVSTNVPALSGSGRFFLACLTWGDPAADTGDSAYRGPVGLLVLDGLLLIGDSGTLEAGSCVAFPAQSPRRLRAGDPPPTVLMFGALPADGPLMLPVTATAGASATPERIEFACEDDSAPAAEPAAASLAPLSAAFSPRV